MQLIFMFRVNILDLVNGKWFELFKIRNRNQVNTNNFISGWEWWTCVKLHKTYGLYFDKELGYEGNTESLVFLSFDKSFVDSVMIW